MRKIFTSLSLIFLVVACDRDSSLGSSDESAVTGDTTGSDSDSGPDSSSTFAGSSGESGDESSGYEMICGEPQDDYCLTCLMFSNCCDVDLISCANEPKCMCLVRCLSIDSDSQACMELCSTTTEDIDSSVNCAVQSCWVSCGGDPSGDGDGDGDPGTGEPGDGDPGGDGDGDPGTG